MAAERSSIAGPVLQAGERGRAVLQAIVELNPGAQIIDQGAYIRIQVPDKCVLTRAAVEKITGLPFHIPGDLELVMPSFQGWLVVTPERVEWRGRRP
ncbi:MAG TPA: MmoB/DmpM family protein [Polyangiaceae bacterium]|nr:MmoB/DmpM family protein [Polyangiaceae bacterium]